MKVGDVTVKINVDTSALDAALADAAALEELRAEQGSQQPLGVDMVIEGGWLVLRRGDTVARCWLADVSMVLVQDVELAVSAAGWLEPVRMDFATPQAAQDAAVTLCAWVAAARGG